MRSVKRNSFTFLLLHVVLLLFCLPVAQSLLTARGPREVILNVDAVKGTGNAAHSNGRLELWCCAVDQQSGRVVPIKRASFHFGTSTRHDAQLSGNSFNATLVRENSPAIETGTWRCDLHTAYGNATKNIAVFVRPVVYSNNTSLRVDEKEGSQGHYSITGLTAVRGSKVVLQCPVHGHPKPDIVWKKGNEQIRASGETLTLDNVDSQNEGTYLCISSNQFAVNGKWQRFQLTVERQLRIKSEFAWVLPLVVILVIAVLLVLVILFCECRKRREQKPIIEED